jgi:transposase InsO family protein
MGVMTPALIDTGASRSLINHAFWMKIRACCPRLRPSAVKLITVTGDDLQTHGCVSLVLDKIGKHEFIIAPHIATSVLLGTDFLEKFQVEINYQHKVVNTKAKSFPLMFSPSENIPHIEHVTEIAEMPSFLSGLEHHEAFRDALGHCTVGEPLRILTHGPPISQKAYRQPLVRRQIVEEEVQKMLRDGVIRPSQSPWSSPITLIGKPDGSIRFCVDYRKVNAVTERDSYPIPHIQELLDTLQGSKIFTTLDLRSGYWQVDLHPDDIPKSAFICHCGLYEFTRLPFGLVNAPSQFQRLMNMVLSEHIGKICLVYIDDIVIFSKTKEEHRKHVQMVLDTIAAAGLTLKMKKCHFGQEKVRLLGYNISAEGISAQEDKVAAIRDMDPPTDVKALQRFLGMANYYRQTIQNYADIAEPLVRLTRKGELFYWGEDQHKAFNALKAALTSDKVMAYPDPKLPYKLFTDASSVAIGAILTQEQDGVDRPIHYVSKTLSEGQKKWSAIEREAWAVIYALTKLRPYLQGADYKVYTDHKPLRSLFLSELKNSRCQRWSMLMSEMGCKIEYRQGKNNVRADMLSRLPEPKLKVESVQNLLETSSVGKEQKQEFPREWEEAETDESDEYIIENGELFSLKLPYMGALNHPRLLAPASIRSKLITETHTELGHRGRFAMLRHLQNFAVWPQMGKDIKTFLSKCPHCQGNRRNTRGTAPEVTDTPSRPFQRIGTDLTGPFIPSPAGNKYMLAVIDHLTGWAEVYPIPDKRSETVWKKLNSEFFPRFGFPEVLISDQGQEYNSNAFRDGLRLLGINHKRTTPGHPETNGLAERFHRTLKETLRKLCNNRSSQWEEQLGNALWAYRASEMETRGSSPYYLLFGQIPNGPSSQIQNETRFDTLARAQRHCYDLQEKAKQYRQSHSTLPHNRAVAIGDMITINCAEPVTLSHLRDHSFRVVSVRGKVIGYVPVNTDRPGRVRYINVNRVRVVPDDGLMSNRDLAVIAPMLMFALGLLLINLPPFQRRRTRLMSLLKWTTGTSQSL